MENSALSTSIASGGFLSLLWKHKFWVITFLIFIPSVIMVLTQAIQEKNYSLPFTVLGTKLISADEQIYQSIKAIEQNPNTIIPLKPENSLFYYKIKYYWLFFWKVIWNLISNLWFIIFNFTAIYWLFILRNNQEKGKNILLALMTMVILQMFLSMIFIIIGKQPYSIPEGLNTSGQIWFVTKSVLPFKGIFSLIKYVVIFLNR